MNFQTALNPDNSIAFSWDYEEVSDLRGFEIFMNGQKIAGREKLLPGTRTFQLGKPEGNQTGTVRFYIRAIGEGVYSSNSLEKIIQLNRLAVSDAKSPSGLKSKLIRKDGKTFAELTWSADTSPKSSIKGYAFFADYAKEGKVLQMRNVPLIKSNSFLYELPDLNRKQYTFRIVPVDGSNQTGPYAETILKLGN